jgi:hypothetical protein
MTPQANFQTEFVARAATSHSLNTSTSLDPAKRISLMVLDPSGLVT